MKRTLLTLLLLAPAASGQQQCYVDQYGNKFCAQQGSGYSQQRDGYTGRYVTSAPMPAQPQVSPAPWRCKIDTDDGSRASGSLICSGDKTATVLTNWHVIRDSKNNQAIVTFPNGHRLYGRVTKYDAFYDLASIEIANPGIQPPELQLTPPQGILTAGGFGDGRSFQAIRGPITRYVYYGQRESGEPMPVISGAARAGDSGGGVVTEDKKFTGVLWGTVNNETYLTAGEPLAKFVDLCCRGQRPSTGWPSQPQPPVAINPRPEQPIVNPPIAINPPRPTNPIVIPPPNIIDPGPTPEPPIVVNPPRPTQPIVIPDQDCCEEVKALAIIVRENTEAIANLTVKVNNIKIEKGEQGEQGEQGPPGEPGDDADITKLELKLDALIEKLDQRTPIRVWLPGGEMVGESYTNIYQGEAIDLTFDPRAMLERVEQLEKLQQVQ